MGMGQLIASLYRAIVLVAFAVWMFFVVFPHPDRRTIAAAILFGLAITLYAAVGLWRDLQRNYPVERNPASTGPLAVMEQNVMDQTKPWYQSKTILGATFAAVAGGAQLIGYTITPADQAALVDGAAQIGVLVSSAVSLVGGVVAIWGRIVASKAIGPTKTA